MHPVCGDAGNVTTTIEVAVLPSEGLAIEADCYVVIDVLRATTTIATLFGQGLRGLLALDDIDEARSRAKADSRLLFGEVHGLRPEGFDFGNSPVEAKRAGVHGREAVLFTTNGTRALCALGAHGVVLAGAIANREAIAGAVSKYERVALVCAGEAMGRRFGLDDFVAAGSIAGRILALNPGAVLDDAARIAAALASAALEETLRSSHHANRTRLIGLGHDIDFALEADTSDVAPMVTACGEGWALLEAV